MSTILFRDKTLYIFTLLQPSCWNHSYENKNDKNKTCFSSCNALAPRRSRQLFDYYRTVVRYRALSKWRRSNSSLYKDASLYLELI